MREELGRDASAYELFKKLHQKKDGTWVDARSKTVDDEMNARFLEASQPNDDDSGSVQIPSIEDQNEMYILAVEVKKKRLYGLGSQAEVLYPEAMSGHATRTRTNSSMDVAAAKAEAAAATSRVEELTKELTTLQQQVRYLMEHALIDPQSAPFSSARHDDDDDVTQP
ncbi:uncharacterized protein [Henckelia pumila]|uniref:uncharacterized protein n=1 Tax=Henckelia pumila TaxID=405737 RepID=UPI003C6E351B